MEIDPIDAIAVAIVRAELRHVFVRQPRRLLDFLIAGKRSERSAARRRPRRFARDRVAEYDVAREGVEIPGGRGLVCLEVSVEGL
jgi:hypothetical protein